MNLKPGIIGFPLAPFRNDLSLDLETLERDIERMARAPFCALNIPAGISEVFSLSPDEMVAMLETTVRVTAGRKPVIGCVAGSLALAREVGPRMERAGADLLLVLPPAYPNAPFDGLLAYYRGVAALTGLPLILYSRGWAKFAPEQVARLAEKIPSLRFWKDGQGDVRLYRRIMAKVGGRLQWIGGAGDDCAAAYAAIGVRLFTSSVSPVAERLALAWGRAALDRDFDGLHGILERCIDPLFALRSRKRGFEVSVMKKARELLGRPVGPPRPPLPVLSAGDTAELAGILSRWSDYLD